MKHLLCAVMFGCALLLSAASVKVANGGKAVSAIVIGKDANRTVKYAAGELQNYFRLITTCKVPIVELMPAGGKNTTFVLGTVDSPLVEKFIGKDKNAAKLKFDGYAVFAKGNTVVIYSKTPRGVLNGVHRFMMKHTDFIWVRPLGGQAI